DGDVEGGLVPGVVVAREPPRRDFRLPNGERAVGGADPRVEPVDVHTGWNTCVFDDERRQAVLRQRPGRLDGELGALLVEFGFGPVHPHRFHRKGEVQVERRQLLRRPGHDGGRAGKVVITRLVAQLDVVVRDVVAAVAVTREVGIAYAGSPRSD